MSSNFDERAGVVWVRTEWGRWHQTAQEVNIEVQLEEGTRGKEVNVVIAPRSIECSVRGVQKFKGPLFGTVLASDSTWTVEDRRTLHLLLVKSGKAERDRDELFWPSLMADGSLAPANSEEAMRMRNKFDLELFQIENPGFDFSNAKLDKRYDDREKRKEGQS